MPRVLVVEDSRTQAEEVRIILESEGFEVEIASDGQQGFDRFAQAHFDLVLSDILMPVLSGYELCRLIKADPKTRHVPVILLTTLNDPLDIIQGLECGADNFVTKPYGAEHLVARIRAFLASREMRAAKTPADGVELYFMGRHFNVTSDREQILDLLVSTFEDIVRTNHDLRARERELDAANKELEAFSYSVSHDLRAPLRSIDGFSQILMNSHAAQLDDKGRDCLKRVLSAAHHMGELIDDLLELSRVSRTDLRRQRANLSEIARTVVTDLRRMHSDRTVDVEVQDHLVADADPRLLRVALDNLIGNAWKFTAKASEAKIWIGAEETAEGTVYFVRDNGAGFNMEYAAKLFRPFQRLHSNAEFAGTGIGLATVHRIVDRHGGRVWAEGEVGMGATVYFTLQPATAS